MDAAEFQRVYAAFEEFHSFFAPAFERKEWREHSRHYLQAAAGAVLNPNPPMGDVKESLDALRAPRSICLTLRSSLYGYWCTDTGIDHGVKVYVRFRSTDTDDQGVPSRLIEPFQHRPQFPPT